MPQIRKGNVEPYLKLIGFGELKDQIGEDAFIVASVVADELEQAIDRNEAVELDGWYGRRIRKNQPYSDFHKGLEELSNETSPMLVGIRLQARTLLTIIPKPYAS